MVQNVLYSVLFLFILSQSANGQTSNSDDPTFDCYEPGGACKIQYDFDSCDIKYDASNFTEYDTCNCESGYVSLIQACEDCQASGGEETDGDAATSSSVCSSLGVTIAPIPMTVSSVFTGQISANTSASDSSNTATASQISFFTTVDGGPTRSIPSIPVVSATLSSKASESSKINSLDGSWSMWALLAMVLTFVQ